MGHQSVVLILIPLLTGAAAIGSTLLVVSMIEEYPRSYLPGEHAAGTLAFTVISALFNVVHLALVICLLRSRLPLTARLGNLLCSLLLICLLYRCVKWVLHTINF